MATYAIGDIQGCFAELQSLLASIEFDQTRDRLWFVGDLVNRGPQSLETLRYVKSLGTQATVVLGNHDLHLIMRSAGFGREARDDTIAPILEAEDSADIIDWLRAQPLFHVEGDYAMVHAGLLPQWSVQQAQELAVEASAALRADNYVEFLANMWGSKPAAWDDSHQGWDRLRVVINAMTRMRFCSTAGEMEFASKGRPDEPPEGYMPWFDVPARASQTHTIVCGHWSALGLRKQTGLLAIDTGCLWGGELTAVRLEDRAVYQLQCLNRPRPTSWD